MYLEIKCCRDDGTLMPELETSSVPKSRLVLVRTCSRNPFSMVFAQSAQLVRRQVCAVEAARRCAPSGAVCAQCTVYMC